MRAGTETVFASGFAAVTFRAHQSLRSTSTSRSGDATYGWIGAMR